jgi:hypothetical protein
MSTVVLGALAMSAGHIAMTFDQSFLIALLLGLAVALFGRRLSRALNYDSRP